MSLVLWEHLQARTATFLMTALVQQIPILKPQAITIDASVLQDTKGMQRLLVALDAVLVEQIPSRKGLAIISALLVLQEALFPAAQLRCMLKNVLVVLEQ